MSVFGNNQKLKNGEAMKKSPSPDFTSLRRFTIYVTLRTCLYNRTYSLVT